MTHEPPHMRRNPFRRFHWVHKALRASRSALDLAVAVLCLPGVSLFIVAGALWLVTRCVPVRRTPGRRVLLCLVPSGFEEIVEKGVGELITEREEDGYWTHVYSVYWPSRSLGILAWSPRQTIWKVPAAGRFLRRHGFRLSYETLNALMLLAMAAGASVWVRRRVDVIRGQDPAIMGVLAVWLSRFSGVPCCVSIHADHDKRYDLDPQQGTVAFWGRRDLANASERLALRGARQVWVIRPSLIPWVRRYGIDPARIRVIPHGVVPEDWTLPEPTLQAFRARQGFNGQKLVLVVGRLVRTNYVDDVLRIAAIVRRHRQDVAFVVLGDGSERQSLEEMTKTLGIAQAVHWKGFRPREEVRYWRGITDVQLCLMGGFSLLEAAASGRPTISYDVEWHREVIQDRQTGLLIPEHDTAQAAAGLLWVLDHPEEARELATRARRLIEERYTWRATSQSRQAAYDQLIQ